MNTAKNLLRGRRAALLVTHSIAYLYDMPQSLRPRALPAIPLATVLSGVRRSCSNAN